jgi:hypothetical protein
MAKDHPEQAFMFGIEPGKRIRPTGLTKDRWTSLEGRLRRMAEGRLTTMLGDPVHIPPGGMKMPVALFRINDGYWMTDYGIQPHEERFTEEQLIAMLDLMHWSRDGGTLLPAPKELKP